MRKIVIHTEILSFAWFDLTQQLHQRSAGKCKVSLKHCQNGSNCENKTQVKPAFIYYYNMQMDIKLINQNSKVIG